MVGVEIDGKIFPDETFLLDKLIHVMNGASLKAYLKAHLEKKHGNLVEFASLRVVDGREVEVLSPGVIKDATYRCKGKKLVQYTSLSHFTFDEPGKDNYSRYCVLVMPMQSGKTVIMQYVRER